MLDGEAALQSDGRQQQHETEQRAATGEVRFWAQINRAPDLLAVGLLPQKYKWTDLNQNCC